MSRNQNGLAGLGAETDLGRHRVTVGSDVGLIEQFHGHQVDATGLHRQADVVHQAEAVIQLRGERLVGEGVDLVGFAAEDAGMIGVGGVAL